MFDLNRLKETRKRLNITQHYFAKQAGVSQSLIAKIEARCIDPSYSKVLLIEDALRRLTTTKEPTATTIMTKKIISINPDKKANEAIILMKKHNISQLPVIINYHVIGLVSESSILEKDLTKISTLTVQQVMNEPPPLISETTTRTIIASLLNQFPIIIVRKNNKLTGVITKADILRHLV